jgi:hypothetical protein
MNNQGTKLNNYLNIRYDKHNDWVGQIGQENGFVKFASVDRCLRAGIIILTNYTKRGINTVEKIIETWAPTTENDTATYLKNVCEWSGMRPDDPVNSRSIGALIAAMCRQETGNHVTSEQLAEAWKEVA